MSVRFRSTLAIVESVIYVVVQKNVVVIIYVLVSPSINAAQISKPKLT